MPQQQTEVQLRTVYEGDRSRLEFAKQLMEQLAVKRERAAKRAALDYFNSPAMWARDNIRWPEDRGLTQYQEDILNSVVDKHRVAVRSPHGSGKTTMAALLCLWFVTTREQMGVDWKVITTASNWNQLTHFLWPEVHKWSRRLTWNRLKLSKWQRSQQIFAMNIKGTYGEAFGLSPADPQGLEGAHATELLYIFDESKAIVDAIFDAAEGAFSTAGLGVGTNAYAFAISTPGVPAGRFYAIHARHPGTEDWWARHITLQECLAAGQVTQEWVDQRRLMWGESSAVFLNRVMGEFAADAADSVVPLAWIELANERWRAKYVAPNGYLRGKERTPHDGTPAVVKPGEKLHVVGVDVARSGEDRCVYALRQGNTICELRRRQYTDSLMDIANDIEALQKAHGTPKAIVDANGIGAGVADRLRELRQPVSSFVAQAGCIRRDASGDYGMANARAWSYWNLREMLTPYSGCDVALPPDDRLTGDLTAIKWRPVAGGRILIEDKEDIRKRLNRSCDDADAVAMAFYTYGESWASVYSDTPPVETPFGTPTGVHRRAGSFADLFKSPEQVKREHLERIGREDVKPRVIVLMGVPGSGKSTFAEARAEGTIISLDALIGLSADSQRDAIQRLHHQAEELLEQGKDVVIDGCNVDAAHRAQWRNLAQTAGATAHLVVVHADRHQVAGVQRSREPGRAISDAKMTRYWEQYDLALVDIESEGWESVEHASPMSAGGSAKIPDMAPAPRQQTGWFGGRQGSWFASTR